MADADILAIAFNVLGIPVAGVKVLDCCAGDNQLAFDLVAHFGHVSSNDVDQKARTQTHFDVRRPEFWQSTHGLCEYIITKPPADLAEIIVHHGEQRYVLIALLLSTEKITQLQSLFAHKMPSFSIGLGSANTWVVWAPSLTYRNLFIELTDNDIALRSRLTPEDFAMNIKERIAFAVSRAFPQHHPSAAAAAAAQFGMPSHPFYSQSQFQSPYQATAAMSFGYPDPSALDPYHHHLAAGNAYAAAAAASVAKRDPYQDPNMLKQRISAGMGGVVGNGDPTAAVVAASQLSPTSTINTNTVNNSGNNTNSNNGGMSGNAMSGTSSSPNGAGNANSNNNTNNTNNGSGGSAAMNNNSNGNNNSSSNSNVVGASSQQPLSAAMTGTPFVDFTTSLPLGAAAAAAAYNPRQHAAAAAAMGAAGAYAQPMALHYPTAYTTTGRPAQPPSPSSQAATAWQFQQSPWATAPGFAPTPASAYAAAAAGSAPQFNPAAILMDMDKLTQQQHHPTAAAAAAAAAAAGAGNHAGVRAADFGSINGSGMGSVMNGGMGASGAGASGSGASGLRASPGAAIPPPYGLHKPTAFKVSTGSNSHPPQHHAGGPHAAANGHNNSGVLSSAPSAAAVAAAMEDQQMMLSQAEMLYLKGVHAAKQGKALEVAIDKYRSMYSKKDVITKVCKMKYRSAQRKLRIAKHIHRFPEISTMTQRQAERYISEKLRKSRNSNEGRASGSEEE